MTFKFLDGREVSRCLECPNAVEVPHPWKFLPPALHCRIMLDAKFKEGKTIVWPLVLSPWCPLDTP